MADPRSIAKRSASLIRNLFPRRTAHREIAVIGPEASGVRGLSGHLLNTVVDGASVLVSDDRMAVALQLSEDAGTLDLDATSFPALHINPGRAGRRRLWRFHLPVYNPDAESDESGPWQKLSDVMLLNWPVDRFDVGVDKSLGEIFRLVGALAMARDRGRLRRAAIVVSDVPVELGPQHPCQVKIRLARNESLREGLLRQLDEGRDESGHPLADPHWRSFLSEKVATSASLERLYEGARMALGRDIPLVFLTRPLPRKEDPADLLDWIADERPRGARKGAGLTRALNMVLAAALVFGLVGLGRLHTGNAAATADLPMADRQLDSLVGRAGDHHERSGRWPRSWLAGRSDAGGLRDSLLAATTLPIKEDEIEVVAEPSIPERFGDWRAGFLATSEQVIESMLDSSSEGGGLAGIVPDTLLSWIEQRDAWRLELEENQLPTQDLESVDRRIERAGILAAMGSLTFDSTGDGSLQDPHGTVAAAFALLTEAGLDAGASQIGELLKDPSWARFLAAYNRLVASDSDLGKILSEAVPLLPAVEADAILDRIQVMSICRLVAQKKICRNALRRIINTAETGPIAGRTFITEAQNERAIVLLDALEKTVAPRFMTIRLFRPDSLIWHVDVSVAESGPWQYSRSVGDGGDAIFSLQNVIPCSRIYMVLDQASRDHIHAAGAEQSVRCPGDARPQSLSARSGVWTLDGISLQYEIATGWPDTWPVK